MPKIKAICDNCASSVPLDIVLKDGASATFENHTVLTPCPQCGGSLKVRDGIYTASSYKIKYSKTKPSSASKNSTKEDFKYGDYVRKLAREFEYELSKIESEHNFELGTEFEKAICKILRRVLPDHFGVCQGYVVNEHGDCEGDDIIIYDRMRFPRLRPVDESDIDTKQRIPIESVYAYIEAKHTISLSGTGGQSFAKAIEQVGNVKALCNTRTPLSRRALNRYVTLGENISQVTDDDWPKIRNPIFTAIFARYVRLKEGGSKIEPQDVIEALGLNLKDIPSPFENSPDLVVLGNDAALLPVLGDTNTDHREYVSPFLVESARLVSYSCAKTSFGVALCNVLYALDWLELGRIRWEGIIGEVVGAISESS